MENKIVVVTGGANGLGKELTLQLLDKGHDVYAIDRDSDALQRLKNEVEQIAANLHTFEMDLAAPTAFADIFEDIQRKLPRVDIWINNAGIMPSHHLTDLTPELYEKVFSINLKFPMVSTQKMADFFIQNKIHGEVINVASMMGVVPLPYASVYSSSKAALIGFSKSIQSELFDNPYVNIRLVLPGSIETRLLEDSNKATFPPVLTPNTVAAKIIKTIGSKKHKIILPWYLNFLSKLQELLGLRLHTWISKKLGLFNLLKPKG